MSRRGFLKGQFFAPIKPQQDTFSTTSNRPAPVNPQSISSDLTPPPGIESNQGPQMKLPDLNQTILDSSTLHQLFHDIETCTEVLDVIPKRSPRYSDNQSVTLDRAKALLINKTVRGIQIRYKYENAEWWDTLVCTDLGTKLVRIRHDFG